MDERDPLTRAGIAAAIEVHRELGPGLLETQLLTYLHLTKVRPDSLIHLCVPVREDGIRRMVL